MPWLSLAPLLLSAGCGAFDPSFGELHAHAEEYPSADAGGAVVFARDIRPLMNRSATDPSGHGCKACHYATESSHIGIDLGALDLTSLGSLRKGGVTSSTMIVVAGAPEASAIVQKLLGTYAFGARMPKDGPSFWSPDEIDLVRTWIAEGAKGSDDE